MTAVEIFAELQRDAGSSYFKSERLWIGHFHAGTKKALVVVCILGERFEVVGLNGLLGAMTSKFLPKHPLPR